MFKSNNGMSRALVRRETIAGYLFLLPSLFFFVTFVLYPMFMCIYTSLFDSNMGKNAVDVFVGLDNYKELFQDELFLGALKNTVIIVVVAVPTVCAFSLWVATAIYDMKPALTSAFRCIFYLPVVTGSVAVTVVWKWMYNNRYGVFNYLLKSTGIIDQNINWLGDARFALWCIILILFTTSVGQPIVLWDVDTLDWKTRNAASSVQTVLNQVKDGSVVLMHELYNASGDAAVTIIPALVERGYQLVTVSELAQFRGGLAGGTVYYSFHK